MVFVDKTEYIEKLENLDPEFRILVLRPRRFGKSTFLDMLCLYYDVHGVNDFDQLFGPLYIGKYPTPSHNTHLVLRFDLSTIDTDSYEEMQVAFNEIGRASCRERV